MREEMKAVSYMLLYEATSKNLKSTSTKTVNPLPRNNIEKYTCSSWSLQYLNMKTISWIPKLVYFPY